MLKCRKFVTNPIVQARYNLRKLGELGHHLAKSGRLDELCKHCLFNFHWLHAKLSAEPLAALLADFADAIKYIEDEEKVRQVQLVADCLRLGGSVLTNHPSMLGPQLTARLLPLLPSSPLIQSLVRQCDRNAGNVNCLVPAFHCLHTPGG